MFEQQDLPSCPRCSTVMILAPGIGYFCPADGCELKSMRESFHREKKLHQQANAMRIQQQDRDAAELSSLREENRKLREMLDALELALSGTDLAQVIDHWSHSECEEIFVSIKMDLPTLHQLYDAYRKANAIVNSTDCAS